MTATPAPFILSAFDMVTPVHQSPGLWRHPESRAHEFDRLSFWTDLARTCLLYTSPSPRDLSTSRMPSSA